MRLCAPTHPPRRIKVSPPRKDLSLEHRRFTRRTERRPTRGRAAYRWPAADSRRARQRENAGRHAPHRAFAASRGFTPRRFWPSPSPTKPPTRCGTASPRWRPARGFGSGRFTALACGCCGSMAGWSASRRTLRSTTPTIQQTLKRVIEAQRDSRPPSYTAERIAAAIARPRTSSSRPTSTSRSAAVRSAEVVAEVYPAYQQRLLPRRRSISTTCCCTSPACCTKTPKSARSSTSVHATSWSTSTRTPTGRST